MTTPETPAAPATKIVIVAGQEFAVPAETENEAIRQQLLAMGFADVAAATIQKGTRDGAETIEFVKKAGTKGMDGAELASLLGTMPPAQLGKLPLNSGELLRQLDEGLITVGQALANERTITQALDEVTNEYARPRREGAVLCDRVDRVPAVPCATPCAW